MTWQIGRVIDTLMPTASKADIFARYFCHSQQHYIVVCLECCTAVVPKHVATHLARNYSRTTKHDQTDIQWYIDRLEDVAYDVSGVIFLGPEDLLYDMIVVQYDGL
jgi:uncharacterized UBP type Zn finger protein